MTDNFAPIWFTIPSKQYIVSLQKGQKNDLTLISNIFQLEDHNVKHLNTIHMMSTVPVTDKYTCLADAVPDIMNELYNKSIPYQILDMPIQQAPYTTEQMKALKNKDNYITGNLVVHVSELINNDLESFLDRLSEALTGSPLLMNIDYSIIGVLSPDDLIIKVSGDVTAILEPEPDIPEDNPIDMELQYKQGIPVKRQGNDADDAIECPVCKWEVARNDDFIGMRPKHCPECGTKLIY